MIRLSQFRFKIVLAFLMLGLLLVSARGAPSSVLAADADSDSISRGDFIQQLVSSAELLPPQSSELGNEPYIQAAIGAGWIKPQDFAKGDWTTPITRTEVAKLTVIASKKHMIGSKEKPDDLKWFYLAMSNGIMTSFSEVDRLGKYEKVTIQEAQAICTRFSQVLDGNTLPIDKRATSVAEIMWHRTNMMTMFNHYLYNLYDEKGQVIGTKKKGTHEDPYRQQTTRASWDYLLTSADKQYQTEMTGLYVIDLDDPKDPYLNKIPGRLNEFYWEPRDFETSYITVDGKKVETRTKHSLAKVKDAYLVVLNQKVLINKISFREKQWALAGLYKEGAMDLSLRGVAVYPENTKEHNAFLEQERTGKLLTWNYVFKPTLFKHPSQNHYTEIRDKKYKMYVIPKKALSTSRMSVTLNFGISSTVSATHNLFTFNIGGYALQSSKATFPVELT
ncbi:hypothetical protein [Cohnella lupini]|uniref:S-layer family protein n=1 Tax=Cohnella lupini TaxID=1294267 RepID=A0A3D9I1R8_9BACL|nr:hypothetical protein [Cohnella lupini]RED55693.1 hypothetical protein DFP95_11619 [Cohnella lupini]